MAMPSIALTAPGGLAISAASGAARTSPSASASATSTTGVRSGTPRLTAGRVPQGLRGLQRRDAVRAARHPSAPARRVRVERLYVLEAEAALDAEVAVGDGVVVGEVTFTIALSCTCSSRLQPTPQ